jgi:hypothetical protein
MASSNNRSITPPGSFQVYSSNSRTHEGGYAPLLGDLEMLRRSTLTYLLGEDQFYESGQSISDRIASLVPKVDPEDVYNLAIEAKNIMKLRHVPLLLAVEMLKYPEHKKLVRKLTARIIQRPDEITEILSIYWKNDVTPVRNKEGEFISQRAAPGRKIPMQLKRGCQDAFAKFDQYQMLKWQERDKPVSMRDAICMIHPDPTLAIRQSYNITTSMADVYKGIVQKTALAPDTWEFQLSKAGKEAKKDIFTDLLTKKELGAFALIANLRGMIECGVDLDMIRIALCNMNVERVLPYRFITAARYAPSLKAEIQQAMFRCIEGIDKLPGKTILLVDISSSMSSPMSRRRDGRSSELKRIDGAAALCILAQSICAETSIYLFNTNTYTVKDKLIDRVNETKAKTLWYDDRSITNKQFKSQLVGFELSEAIGQMVTGGTDLQQAVSYINKKEEYDRFIIFSDDESSTSPENPKALGFSINIASSSLGVAYDNWCKISGFSENVLTYITEYEKDYRGVNY